MVAMADSAKPWLPWFTIQRAWLSRATSGFGGKGETIFLASIVGILFTQDKIRLLAVTVTVSNWSHSDTTLPREQGEEANRAKWT